MGTPEQPKIDLTRISKAMEADKLFMAQMNEDLYRRNGQSYMSGWSPASDCFFPEIQPHSAVHASFDPPLLRSGRPHDPIYPIDDRGRGPIRRDITDIALYVLRTTRGGNPDIIARIMSEVLLAAGCGFPVPIPAEAIRPTIVRQPAPKTDEKHEWAMSITRLLAEGMITQAGAMLDSRPEWKAEALKTPVKPLKPQATTSIRKRVQDRS